LYLFLLRSFSFLFMVAVIISILLHLVIDLVRLLSVGKAH
jgi:hypothetical protein